MFTDYTSDVVGFTSISHIPREVADGDCQTPARISKDQHVQLQSFLSAGTQTQPPAAVDADQYDEEALAHFLNRIVPLVLEELELVVDFTDIEDPNDEEESTAVKLTSLTELAGSEKKVTSICWSSTGGSVAAGTAAARHHSWCNHTGRLVIYSANLHRPIRPRIIEAAACVTAVRFHPWEPSIIAAGFYNGEVILKDLRKDDDSARECQVEHKSPVVYLGWSGTVNEPLCVSAGADGRILLWKYGLQSESLTVAHRFLVTNSHLNQKTHDSKVASEVTAMAAVGGDNFAIGAAGGGLYLAKLSPLTPLPTHPDHYDPVIMAYQQHRAVITSISATDSKNTFATTSCDGELRIYTVTDVEPKHVIHLKGCLLDCFWTDTPTVVGVCGIKNQVKFVRITTGQELDINLEISGRKEATRAKPNRARNIVAVGDSDGTLELWRVNISKRSG